MSQPTPRLAARVLVVDELGCMLLFRGGDPGRPGDGTWWFTPGGGLEGAETYREAAVRELREETGFESLGPQMLGPVFADDVLFEFDGAKFTQHQKSFVIHVDRFEVVTLGWTEQEQRVMVESRWWSVAELESTADTIYPATLAELLARA